MTAATAEIVAAAAAAGRLAPAYLITGSDAAAVGEAAREAARLISDGEPRIQISPDEDRVKIAIDQVRDMRVGISLKAGEGVRRAILIEPADRCTPDAANALLKSLEEPPAGVTFLLATTAPARLPATIRSRCQTIRVPSPAEAWTAEDDSRLRAARAADPWRLGESVGAGKSGRESVRDTLALLLRDAGRRLRAAPTAAVAAQASRYLAAIRDLDANLNPRLILESAVLPD